MWFSLFLSLCFMFGSSSSANFEPKVFLKLFEDCLRTDWESCLKIKILSTMEKFRNAKTITVVEGITLVDENFAPDSTFSFSEDSLEGMLPRNMDHRNDILNSLLFEKLFHWVSRYTLRWKLSNLRNTIYEGRGKSKKYSHLLLMPLMMTASFVPLALGTLAILAGKALIIGKMALILTAILGIRKLFSNSHEEDEHQRAMKRITDFGMRLRTDMMAHKMAYRGSHMNDLQAM